MFITFDGVSSGARCCIAGRMRRSKMGMDADHADKFLEALKEHNVNSAESLRHLEEPAWAEHGATEQLRIVCLALMAHIE